VENPQPDLGGMLSGQYSWQSSPRLGAETPDPRQLQLPWPNHAKTLRFTTSGSLLEFVYHTLVNAKTEHLFAVYLDVTLHLLRVDIVGRGTPSSVDFRLRDVLRAGLEIGAGAFVLIHNHPSGIARPSLNDIAITKKIFSISCEIDMPLLDHFIVTRNEIKRVGNW
jgi:DNA repair protein RadC